MQYLNNNIVIIIGTWLLVLLTTTSADPCAPLGSQINKGSNCVASTVPTVTGSDGTRFVATANIAYCTSGDNYLFAETRFGSDSINVAAGDQFEYSIWWDQIDTHCLLDVVNYLGAPTNIYLRNDPQLQDANGFYNHPRLDISQYAYRKWYTRRFVLPDYASTGSNPIAITVSCDTPDTSIGEKKFFFKGVKILDGAGNVKNIIADETLKCDNIVGCAPLCSNGVCDLDQTCQCGQGWSDSVCSTPICLASCNNGACTQPNTCTCLTGWQGTVCDSAICASCSAVGGSCIAPDTCQCRQGYSDVNCNTYCTGSAPFAGVECQTINGTSVWVYNNTLVVDTTVIDVDVTVIGDLIVQYNLTLTDGAVITVTGCPVISGSLALQLTAEEIEQLLQTGTLTRTVLLYNAACSVNDFSAVTISNQNELKCVTIQQSSKKSPGQLSVLVTATQTDCRTDAPLNPNVNTAPILPDWGIAIIVVVPVVATGIGLAVGLVKRQRAYDKEMARIGG